MGCGGQGGPYPPESGGVFCVNRVLRALRPQDLRPDRRHNRSKDFFCCRLGRLGLCAFFFQGPFCGSQFPARIQQGIDGMGLVQGAAGAGQAALSGGHGRPHSL
jgi:hypothetical protein